MVLTRSVYARLVERFIFNFRLPPDVFASHLPVQWLKPQILNGWSVASFCVLKLDRLTLWPLPSFLGFDTISCAYRCGVIDTTGASPEPSVYITDRNTDRPIVARLGPLLFADTMPMVRLAIARAPDFVEIHASYLDGQHLFSAELKPSKTPAQLNSQLFDSLNAFVNFIKAGVSSYTPSIYDNYLARIDLAKEDANYEAVDATVDYSWLDGAWRDAGLVFDSAVRAGGGGRYKWTYRGLVPKQL